MVDAVAGVADTKKGIPADERTLFPVFSVTKGVTATAVHTGRRRRVLPGFPGLCAGRDGSQSGRADQSERSVPAVGRVHRPHRLIPGEHDVPAPAGPRRRGHRRRDG
ncbi:serine hydrolase [Streptomyces turgidiscabies]|uniref:serine hydrolase n=1 Tax=Streptomyces TaxID=1883 RepID=UPI0038F7DC35